VAHSADACPVRICSPQELHLGGTGQNLSLCTDTDTDAGAGEGNETAWRKGARRIRGASLVPQHGAAVRGGAYWQLNLSRSMMLRRVRGAFPRMLLRSSSLRARTTAGIGSAARDVCTEPSA
jgi:hypothetical protein